MKEFFDATWKVCVLVLLLLILVAVKASAESAIVSFNDAEHLVAITDSIVGVCDTAEWKWEPCYLRADSCVVRGNHVFAYYPDTYTLILPKGNDSCQVQVYPPIITCRELVSRTVTKFPEKMKDVKCIPCPIIPGTVIITWRKQ